nr:hypothetical protein CFP56_00298 [Quercus suber]
MCVCCVIRITIACAQQVVVAEIVVHPANTDRNTVSPRVPHVPRLHVTQKRISDGGSITLTAFLAEDVSSDTYRWGNVGGMVTIIS